MGILNFLKDTIGIDPGSQYLRIIKDGKIVFNEQTQISIDKNENVVSGLGNSIRTTANDVIIRPINYVIADFQGFEMLLRGAIKKGQNSRSLFPKSYRMFYSIPTGLTEVEKRAYRDSGEHAGAIEVYMIYQSCCSAIGMNLLIEKKDFMLVDLSSSKFEITIFANGKIISEGVIKMGIWKIVRLLKNHFFRKYKIDVSEKEIEFILTSINNVDALKEIKIQYATVSIAEIQNLLDNLFNLVNDEFLEAIERVSNHPDMEKVIVNGVFFTGGGSTIDFLRDKIKLDNRIKKTISQNPLSDNINGLILVMADKNKYKDYIMV